MSDHESEVKTLVDHLFRRHTGQMVATLTRIYGPDKIDLAESVVQEAILKALQNWSFNGIPDKPVAWLIQVAKNLALDSLRREGRFNRKQSEIIFEIEALGQQTWFDDDIELSGDFKNDQLKMMFVTCHPVIKPSSQIALVLKILCGFSVEEVSKAFLVKRETIEQRIVRAKKKIKEEGLKFDFPDMSELEERLDSVLSALYLLFNEGYVSHSGSQLIKKEVCEEAIRLLNALIAHPLGRKPKSFALLALFLFQYSRLDARTDKNGDIVLLRDQDRSRWDDEATRAGIECLNSAASGEELSSYHLEAGIAACHATSRSFAETDWGRIVSYYEDLLRLNPSPVVYLNYAVAVSEKSGSEAGLRMLEELGAGPLERYYLYHATRGELLRKSGRYRESIRCLETAKELTQSDPEKRFIKKCIAEATEALSEIAGARKS